jgi:predicted ATPase/class 3 adenylate cyclase
MASGFGLGRPSSATTSDAIRDGTRRVLTLMFTDIENSTWLWEKHPDDMEPAVLAHHGLISSIVDAAGGSVLRFMGDGALAIFLDAGAALGAAVDIQRTFTDRTWSGVGELRLRIGLNTGRCRFDHGELFGRPPNLAARLESAAHGGQILVSDATAQACRGRLRPGEQLFDLGRYHMRGFEEPAIVHSVVADGLPSVFPPLRTPYLGFDELPTDQSTLHGRDAVIAQVVHLLLAHQLVTLWGPGGVGKTRVALRVAGRVRRPYEHGVRLVDLGVAGEPALVPRAVVAAIRAQPKAGEAERDTVLRVLRHARLLLVLDHCDPVVEGVRDLLSELSDSGSGTHVLATSRETLEVAGECVVEIPTLAVPDEGESAVDRVSAADSVRLFVDRARTHDSHFAIDVHTAGTVARLCRALDGLPLGLELAAARLGVEPLAELVDDLPRILDPRERAGRNVEPIQNDAPRLPASLARLTAGERDLFARLTVFSGPFPRELALRMSTEPTRAFRDFDRLVRTSMVVRDVGTPDRFRLLAIGRELARSVLDETDWEECRSRHARLMLERAETVGTLLRSRDERLATETLKADFPDHRAAFGHFVERGAVDDAARLVVALFQFAQFQPRPEVYGWAEWVAERIDDHRPHATEIVGAAALGAWFAGDIHRAISRGSRAIDIAAHSGGPTIWARTALVDALGYANRLGEGEAHFLALVRELRDSPEEFWQINGLGYEAIGLALFGRARDAEARAERALALARRFGNPDCTQWALYSLGRVLALSDPRAAATAFEHAMDAAREVESRFTIGLALVEWVGLQRQLGNARNAIAGTLDLLDMLAVSGNRSQLSQVLREAGLVLADAGEDEVAALVLLARQGLPEMPRPPHEVPEDETCLAELRRALGDRWMRVSIRAKATAEHDLISLCRAQLTDLLQAPSA